MNRPKKLPQKAQPLEFPPMADLISEKAFAGQVVADPKIAQLARAVVAPGDFHDALCRSIVDVTYAITEQGQIVDAAAVLGRVQQDLGEEYYAAATALYDGRQSADAWQYHANQVRDGAIRRRTWQAGMDLIADSHNGRQTAELLEDTATRLMALRQSAGEKNVVRLPQMTTRELIDTARPPTFLVEGILVAGQHGVLGGFHKTLKTSLADDLAVSLAIGGHFLGYFPVPKPVRVGFISGESGQNTLAETTRRICESARVDPREALGNLTWCLRAPRLTDAEQVGALRRFVIENELAVLLIDPLYLCMQGVGREASNVFSMGDVLGPISDIVCETGCTILLLHHTSRTANSQRGFEAGKLEDLAFSGLSEWARQWPMLARRSAYVDGSGKHELWLSVGGSAGHSGLWSVDVEEGHLNDPGGRRWEITVQSAGDAKASATLAKDHIHRERFQQQLTDDRKELLALVLGCPNQMGTKEDIRTRWKHTYKRFTTALAECLTQRDLAECDVFKGNRKSAYRGYKLATPELQK